MAYATGTVNSASQLKSVITSFCTSNGWSLSGNVLSKGTSFNILLAETSEIFSIQGSNNSAGTLNTCEYKRYTYVTATSWPVTYFIQVNTNPDLVVVVLQYETDKHQQIIFGNISKINNSAFPGGNWFWASKFYNPNLYITANDINVALATNPRLELLDNTNMEVRCSISSLGSNIPFARAFGGEYTSGVGGGCIHANGLHLEIDGVIWDSGLNPIPSNRTKVHFHNMIPTLLTKSPNTWNGQTHLIPVHIIFNANGGQMYLGHVEHLRFCRVDNYNPGDVITLGTDKWKVFPWHYKDSVNRNGSQSINGCLGTLGFAFRYDGA